MQSIGTGSSGRWDAGILSVLAVLIVCHRKRWILKL
jgi:hypothetical protein